MLRMSYVSGDDGSHNRCDEPRRCSDAVGDAHQRAGVERSDVNIVDEEARGTGAGDCQ